MYTHKQPSPLRNQHKGDLSWPNSSHSVSHPSGSEDVESLFVVVWRRGWSLQLHHWRWGAAVGVVVIVLVVAAASGTCISTFSLSSAIDPVSLEFTEGETWWRCWWCLTWIDRPVTDFIRSVIQGLHSTRLYDSSWSSGIIHRAIPLLLFRLDSQTAIYSHAG